MKIVIITLITLLTIFGCKSEKETNLVVENQNNLDTIRPNQSRLKFLKLKKRIKLKLEGSSSFIAVQEHLNSINNKTYSNLQNTISELSQDLTDFQKTIPYDFKNNQVLSRVNQLKTYCLLLDSDLNNQKSDSLKLVTTIERTLTTYNSLIVQLNETENGISKDFERELEKAKFNKDSLKQSEVAPLF